jgi:hypothetical protein
MLHRGRPVLAFAVRAARWTPYVTPAAGFCMAAGCPNRCPYCQPEGVGKFNITIIKIGVRHVGAQHHCRRRHRRGNAGVAAGTQARPASRAAVCRPDQCRWISGRHYPVRGRLCNSSSCGPVPRAGRRHGLLLGLSCRHADAALPAHLAATPCMCSGCGAFRTVRPCSHAWNRARYR